MSKNFILDTLAFGLLIITGLIPFVTFLVIIYTQPLAGLLVLAAAVFVISVIKSVEYLERRGYKL